MFISLPLFAALSLSSITEGLVNPWSSSDDIRSVSSCKKALPKGQEVGGTYNITIKSGGLPRWYLMSIPARYRSQTATPVILSYHGGSRDAQRQLDLSQLSNPIFNDFAIAVYPNGIHFTWQGIPGADPKANDKLFTSDILDALERDYCIDSTRIYSSGKSNGGGFTNTLACDPVLSRRIAAFAPVSGSYYVDVGSDPTPATCNPSTLVTPCRPGRAKIPIIVFHGEKDGTIAYSGGIRKGECLPSLPRFVQEWAARDGLGLVNFTSRIGSDTDVYSFGMGLDYGLVTHVADTVIDHDWPSTEPNGDNTQPGRAGPASFNATPVIVDFFLRHTLLPL